MKRFTAILLTALFCNCLFSQSKNLFSDVATDTVCEKKFQAIYIGLEKDIYWGGKGMFGKRATDAMGEVPNTSLIFSYCNEVYGLSCKESCHDVLDSLCDNDSIEVAIKIFPFYGNYENHPFSVVTEVRPISSVIRRSISEKE